MPRVEQVCLESIPIDVENFLHAIEIDNTQAEDVFNTILEVIDDYDCNFWDCDYGYDDIEAEDLTMLSAYVEEDLTMLPAYGNNSLDKILRNYNKHMFIQHKDSILETIQEKLNRR